MMRGTFQRMSLLKAAPQLQQAGSTLGNVAVAPRGRADSRARNSWIHRPRVKRRDSAKGPRGRARQTRSLVQTHCPAPPEEV